MLTRLALALLSALAAFATPSASADFAAAKADCEKAFADGDRAAKTAALKAVADADGKDAAAYLLDLADQSASRALDGLEKKSGDLQREHEAVTRLYEGLVAGAPAVKNNRVNREENAKARKEAAERMKQLEGEIQKIEKEISAESEIQNQIGALLGGMKDAGAREAVLEAVRKEKRWRVRLVACRALGRLKVDGAAEKLAEVLKEDDEEAVRLAAVDALGQRADPETTQALCDAVRTEKVWQLRVAAAEALAKIDDPAAIEPLIDALGGLDGLPRSRVNEALRTLTGEVRAPDPAAWKAWWEGVKDTFAAGRPKKDARAAVVKKVNDPASNTFYGVPVISKHIAFCIDFSGSMNAKAKWKPSTDVESGPGGPKRKLAGDRRTDVARYELCNAIEKLAEDVEFNVYLFNRLPNPLFPELRRATPAVKREAIAAIEGRKLLPNTNIFDTLESCFPKAGAGGVKFKGNAPDTIYLLTDGAPVGGQVTKPKEIREKIAEMNRTARIVIHTIAIEPGKSQTEFLKLLAEENGGTAVVR